MALVRACVSLLLIALFYNYATVQVSADFAIDQVISEAANSSREFQMYDSSAGEVKVELDMLFTREQWEELVRLNRTGDSQRKRRKATRPIYRRWTNNIVPYQLRNDFTSGQRSQVYAAINDWNRYTCLTFRAAGAGDRNKIVLGNGGGCSSYVGMIGGAQYVSLAPGCRIKRIIVHEIGHAVGFQHEQTRPDRDNYVYIIDSNIPSGVRYNFQRYTRAVVNDYGVPYDYTSVMHYGAYAFSSNGRMTIRTKDRNYQHVIGKSPGLSFRDIKLANLMYQCDSKCSTRGACPSGGYRAKDCKCYCRGSSPSNPIKLCSGGGGGGGKKDCVDDNSSCPTWAQKGECKKNPKYMLVHCKKSCKKCGDGGGGGGGGGKGCVDENKLCATWAGKGECDKNPAYMLLKCKKSCKQCQKCDDKNSHCSYWAGIGECKKNPAYMNPNCKKSCNKCDAKTEDTKAPEPCIDENSQCSNLGLKE
ncbi:metalloproteinase nas-13-like [Octopus vulgaris]|uniref:Metalloendopeptidase n=1 Tax=Octopus vulgaris TaxID=6645 RepID=A0AA36FJ24_OCTVU|nr:metalloproteinase nas-13-like [Octopus vulgaris]